MTFVPLLLSNTISLTSDQAVKKLLATCLSLYSQWAAGDKPLPDEYMHLSRNMESNLLDDLRDAATRPRRIALYSLAALSERRNVYAPATRGILLEWLALAVPEVPHFADLIDGLEGELKQ